MANDSSRKPPSDSNTSTRVDLGDDLLAPSIQAPKRGASSSESAPEDQFASARILLSEGFVEDAKKLLRKILIVDPDHAAAKQSLREILDREIKDLLVDRESPIQRPRLFERKGKAARGPQETSDDLIAELEEEFGVASGESAPSDAIFADPAQLKDASGSDRTDLGIAFMEMGLHEQAIAQLKGALDMIDREIEPEPLQKASVTALLARAYLVGGRAYDAIQLLHSVVRDGDIEPSQKVECFYLMGLAHEAIGERKSALPWYAKVRDVDPHYRDIQERMRKPIA